MEKEQLLDKALDIATNKGYVDVVKIANEAGIGVFAVQENEDFNAKITYDKASEKYKLYVNESHTIERQRFSVAHELAHRVLHNAELVTLGKLDRDGDSLMEEAADNLAAEILMPQTLVDRYVASQKFNTEAMSKEDILNISKKFRVSKSVAILRLRDLDYYVPFIQFS